MNYSITQYLLLGAVALVYVGVITGPMRKIAIRYNAVDSPDMARKIQKEPVPYLGGVAIAVGVVVFSYVLGLINILLGDIFSASDSDILFVLILFKFSKTSCLLN